MSEQTHPHPADRITHLGSAVVIPPGTGTIEEATQFETSDGRFVRRITTASEVQRIELFQVMSDGSELFVDGYDFDLAELRARRAAERRASFLVIEGGRCDTKLPPPSNTPSGVEVRPFGEGEDWAVPA